MLRIKTTAWHYRYWKLLHESDSARPRNLCRYFWFLFFAITIPLTIVGFALAGLIALGWVIYGHPVATLIVVVAILAGAVVAVLCFLALKKWLAWYRSHRLLRRAYRASQPAPPPKEPSIVWAFLKAKKAKMCPLIEVYDPTITPPSAGAGDG